MHVTYVYRPVMNRNSNKPHEPKFQQTACTISQSLIPRHVCRILSYEKYGGREIENINGKERMHLKFTCMSSVAMRMIRWLELYDVTCCGLVNLRVTRWFINCKCPTSVSMLLYYCGVFRNIQEGFMLCWMVV